MQKCSFIENLKNFFIINKLISKEKNARFTPPPADANGRSFKLLQFHKLIEITVKLS